MRIIPFAASLSAALLPAPAPARLSPAEENIIHTVDAEQDRTLAMLIKWVEVNSGTLNSAGVASVGKMVAAEFQALGFTVQWVDMSAAHRSGHLIARHAGNR